MMIKDYVTSKERLSFLDEDKNKSIRYLFLKDLFGSLVFISLIFSSIVS